MSADTYIKQAESILRGLHPPPAKEMLELAGRLMKVKKFSFARRILSRARRGPEWNAADAETRAKIRQQQAVCTYKDTDLPADTRLDSAFDILCDGEDLSKCNDPETLGIAGAIYKRKWEVDSQRQQLERALFYYLRGYAQGAPADKRDDIFAYLRDDDAAEVSRADKGYTGINAAFVLDQLAHLEEKQALAVNFGPGAAGDKREQARLIREEIIRTLGKIAAGTADMNWWFHATLGEAYFGLGDYAKATEWLVERPKGLDAPAWEFASTARQLATLAHLQAPQDESIPPAAREVLKRLVGNDEAALKSALLGKIGVGLSGGGFRASLYHIGVLAKLAELDVLRRVEVLSCVSGGSIIGAHYYLEVQNLLESTPDEKITKQDYIDIVRRLEKDFLKGVQKNIRTRIAAQFPTNLKMIFTKPYSRTMRAGDLYESELFSCVKDGKGGEPRYMQDLLINPAGAGPHFTPGNDNWQRTAKVPVLILNAATLNTGHSWHFTATYMGEPPAGIDSEIDGNDFYRRMWYDEAPGDFKKVRLGHAVGASACVQGVFEPISFEGLYPDRTVRLVDGGTCDNQGVGGLLEQDCNVVLISDGSGQMGSQNHPSPGLLGVPLRSVDIVQARVRASQYHELRARHRSGLLRGFMFVHLKGDLDVDPVDWVGCQNPFDTLDEARPPERRGKLTGYGIAKEIQQQLAAVRTDLDSFSDVEAYTLMTSGYRMTELAFRKGCVPGFGGPAVGDEPEEGGGWTFLQVEDGMSSPGRKYDHVKWLLGVSPSKAFKIWMLSKALKVLAVILGIAAAVGTVYAFWRFQDTMLLKAVTLGSLGVAIVMYLLGKVATMVLGKNAMKVIKWRSTVLRIGLGVIVAFLGWIAAGLHLLWFDRMFLKLGSLGKFNGLAGGDGVGAGSPQGQTAGD